LTGSPEALYADASALVKLAVDEPGSAELAAYLAHEPDVFTSELAVVEVTRAATIADPAGGFERAGLVLEACELVRISPAILQHAARLASRQLRTLDALHLATALRIEPDEIVTYGKRLADAATRSGLRTVSPGA
jgi:predicted nucleic acid-binding protein